MNKAAPEASDATSLGRADRSVVLVTSPGMEPTLPKVSLNLATVCAEVGQRVALVSTDALAVPAEGAEEPPMPPLWWLHWPAPEGATSSPEAQRLRLQTDALQAADVEALLDETGVQGVRRLDLRYFVKHPAQVVIRAPQVVSALRQVVDVVILEVHSYLTVHHGEGLTPLADAVLVVGERDNTKMDELRRTKSALTRLGAPVVGVVLTGESQSEEDWDVESEDDSGDEDTFDDTEQLLMGEADKAPGSVSPAGLDDPRQEDGGNGHRAKENGAMEDESSENESVETFAVAKWDAPEA
jgi:Mrp family chromosome partitioning ATPase